MYSGFAPNVQQTKPFRGRAVKNRAAAANAELMRGGSRTRTGTVRNFHPCKSSAFGTCTLGEAACVIITEEGRGNCVYYCYKTGSEGLEQLKHWWCPLGPRILFTVVLGKISGEVERMGLPRPHETILTASKLLRPCCETIQEEPGDEAASEPAHIETFETWTV